MRNLNRGLDQLDRESPVQIANYPDVGRLRVLQPLIRADRGLALTTGNVHKDRKYGLHYDNPKRRRQF